VGTIVEFANRINVDRRLGLLVDVSRGLTYMHEQGVVHGGLRGANILIHRKGYACLAGFSQLTVIPHQSTIRPLAATDDAVPWMSPELLGPGKGGRPTMKSDCYALGMVVYEVLSGQTPFAPHKSNITRMVLEGERPEKPQGWEKGRFVDLWRMLGDLWKPLPDHRPSAEAVFLRLGGGDSPAGRRGGRVPAPQNNTQKSGSTSQTTDTSTSYPPVNPMAGRQPLTSTRRSSSNGGWFKKLSCNC